MKKVLRGKIGTVLELSPAFMRGSIYAVVPKGRIKQNVFYGDYLSTGFHYSKGQLEQELMEYPVNKTPRIQRVGPDLDSIMAVLHQPPLMSLKGEYHTRIWDWYSPGDFPIINYFVQANHATVRVAADSNLLADLSPEAAAIFYGYNQLLLQFLNF